MKIFYLHLLCVITLAQWQYIEQDLFGFSVSSSNWNFQNSCDWSGNYNGGSGSSSYQRGSCNENDLRYIEIESNPSSAYYTSSNQNLPPHYQAKVLIDGYFLDASGTDITINFACENSATTQTAVQYKNSDLPAYQDVCDSGYNRFTITTFVFTFQHTDKQLSFRVCGSGFTSGLKFGFRNFQVFVNKCHWSCLTCGGGGASNCLSCFTNPTNTLSSQSSCPTCPTNYVYIEYLDSSKKCTTECHYYRIPDANNVCQFSENMLPYKTYFTSNTLSLSNSLWTLLPDPINFNIVGIDRTNQIPCTSDDLIGPFYYNEGYQLTLAVPYNISYIRFRVTIYKLGSWPDYTSVQILLDGIEQASLYSISNVLYVRNANKLFFDSSCASATTYRLESKLLTNFTDPILTIKGNMDQNGLYSWGFKNVVMDFMKCQSSCTWCDLNLKCYACSSGFLHKNRCVPSCPVYSTAGSNKCVDFDEISDTSIYLIKAFYDGGNTTDTDVPNIVGTMTTGTQDFKTTNIPGGTSPSSQYYFGYYNSKRALGGPLIWNSAKFTKTFTSLNAHYQYNLKFQLVLGDQFQGSFKYTIGGYSQQSITYSSSGMSSTSKEMGRQQIDKFKSIDITQSHFSSSLTIVLECASSNSIETDFCLIYDYFLILSEVFMKYNQCIEYCTACTGPTWADCTTKLALPTGMSTPTTCSSTSYYFDGSVTPAVCRTCTPSYCLECLSASICTRCDTNYYIVNGVCQCFPWTYQTNTNTCVDCHSQCKECYGGTNSNCLSCYDSQHRFINNNKCQCQAHYYDDGINDICQSICGDMVVTEGEDCDDGNTIRYDGCNNCQYECQVECQVCIKGRCSVCVTGYTLHPVIKICYPTCGDNKIVNQEQCEDNNLTPYDGCFRCSFQCQPQCTNCIDGICYQCDNSIGYYLNTINQQCVTICGDQIIAGGESCDDGNNDPYDGCLSCFFACDSFCSNCIQGVCAKCKSGYQLLNQTNQCEPICGDGILAIYESCDDGNLINYDGCDKCSLECQSQCTNCFFGVCSECNTYGWHYDLKSKRCVTYCGDASASTFYEQCDDNTYSTFEDGCYQCQYSCQQECSHCVAGICLACKTNYYLEKDNLCYPICGDGIISKFEQCDDKNLVYQDGCSICTFECEPSCKICKLGKCQTCQSGYYLNSASGKCIPICGDSQQLGDEQCDFGVQNYVPEPKSNVGCVNCQLKCSPQCQLCAKGVCQLCNEIKGWYLDSETGLCLSKCGDHLISDLEQCDDSNSSVYDGCNSCLFTCQQECAVCFFGSCIKCRTGYNLVDHQCYSICGDGIVVGSEECDFGLNKTDGIGCLNCKYKCKTGCNYCVQGKCLECNNNTGYYLDTLITEQCDSKCGDLLIKGNEQCDENTQLCQSCNFVCPSYCSLCKFGICSSCQSGYYLFQNNCIYQCGAFITIEAKECNSTDIQPFDGCFECKYQCQNECKSCIKGECIQCDETKGWYLSKGKCISKCGDGIIAGQEECDILINLDNGDISQNKCFNCQLRCVDKCQICYKGQCLQCQQGYQLTDQNDCVINCGSFQIQQISIQCNDNNLDSFDGCFNCQYNCQQECQYCIYGICIKCKIGYQLNKDKCEQYCGDGIIIGNEQCDDNNNIQYDGCYQCQYQCTQNCLICNKGKCEQCINGYRLEYPYCLQNCNQIIRYNNQDTCQYNDCQLECQQCIKGQCYKCKDGYYWNNKDQQCQSQCGDGYIVQQEQCEIKNIQIGWNTKQCNQQCQYICPLNCQNCQFGICKQCEQGYYEDGNQCISICGDLIITQNEQCDDGNIIPKDGCFECQYDCPLNCNICIQGLCEKCNNGYYLYNLNTCQPICGDNIATLEEECDDGNRDYYDGCNNDCKYQCSENCSFCKYGQCIFCKPGFNLKGQKCLPICGDGVIVQNEVCDDANISPGDGCYECSYSCQQECLSCQQGQCILCDEVNGWYVEPDGFCGTDCGDLIVAGNEQCDDGNDQNFDGCFNCKYICQIPCTKCLSGNCYECNTPGWRLDNYWCWEICGDGLVVGKEECDDQNETPYDGCFECQLQCDQACLTCVAGFCQLCDKGWKLTDKFRCEADCGDSYVLPQFEDCDDGNLLPYDGCFECSYQCVQYCTDCRKGICYACNTPGWAYDSQNKICIPFCGDGLIVGNEICDDGNTYDYDGCDQNCQYSCHQACLECIKGICLQCDEYLGFIKQNNQCGSKCGDRLWEQETEQCDDGNIFDYDGCSHDCQIENNWYCENQPMQVSNCIYQKEPTVLLDILDQQSNSSLIQVTFSEKMKLIKQHLPKSATNQHHDLDLDDASNLIKLEIKDLNDSDYDYSVQSIIEVEEEPKEIVYNILIQFNEQIKLNKLEVTVIVNKELIQSEHERKIIKNSGYLELSTPYYLTKQQISIANSVSSLNEMQSYCQVGVSGLAVLSSGYSNLFMSLDTLQYLYYTKYININFPENLQIYMKSLKQASLQHKVASRIRLLNQADHNQTQSDQTLPKKFQSDNLSPQFDTNVTTTIITLLTGFTIFVCSLTLSKVLHLISPSKLDQMGQTLGGAILTVRQKCTKISNDFVYSGIIRMVTVNFFEMTFASLLQMESIDFNTSSTNLLNIGSAVGCLVFQSAFIVILFHHIRQIQTKQSLSHKFYIKTLFSHNEGNDTKSIWVMQYNTILLVKKMIYMLIIVSFQQQPLYQTVCIGIQASVFATYLFVSQPFSKVDDIRKALITELGMFVNCMSYLLYFSKDYFGIPQDFLVDLGWFNIGIYSTIMACNLLIDSTRQIRVLYRKIKEYIIKIIRSQGPSQSRVQPLFY